VRLVYEESEDMAESVSCPCIMPAATTWASDAFHPARSKGSFIHVISCGLSMVVPFDLVHETYPKHSCVAAVALYLQVESLFDPGPDNAYKVPFADTDKSTACPRALLVNRIDESGVDCVMLLSVVLGKA